MRALRLLGATLVVAVCLTLLAPVSSGAAARCAHRKLLHTNYDLDDPVVRIVVYQDGKRLRAFHGRRLGRTVALTRLSAAKHLVIRVVFTLSDTHRVILTRTYSGCRGGPLRQKVVTPPRARKEG